MQCAGWKQASWASVCGLVHRLFLTLENMHNVMPAECQILRIHAMLLHHVGLCMPQLCTCLYGLQSVSAPWVLATAQHVQHLA